MERGLHRFVNDAHSAAAEFADNLEIAEPLAGLIGHFSNRFRNAIRLSDRHRFFGYFLAGMDFGQVGSSFIRSSKEVLQAQPDMPGLI